MAIDYLEKALFKNLIAIISFKISRITFIEYNGKVKINYLIYRICSLNYYSYFCIIADGQCVTICNITGSWPAAADGSNPSPVTILSLI